MIRLMMETEQEWTQGSQNSGSPPRSSRSIASSLEPSVSPASALITFHHHHLLSLQPPLLWVYSPLYLQHLQSSCPWWASVCCWMKGWLNQQSRNSEVSFIPTQFLENLKKVSHGLGEDTVLELRMPDGQCLILAGKWILIKSTSALW